MLFPVKILKVEQRYKLVVTDVPGCECEASSIDLGLKQLHQVMTEHLMLLAEYGETIPTASSIDLAQRLNGAEPCIWVLLEFDIVPFLGKSHKINVTLPELLIKRIDQCVSQHPDYKTRSGFIAKACFKELQQAKHKVEDNYY
jgi:hypothetical protein